MAWTYDGSPGTSTAAERRDAVRWLVGDTDTNDQQLTDAEISFALSQSGNAVYGAASSSAKAIAAKYARLVSTSIDSVRSSYEQRQKAYLDLAARLEREGQLAGGELGVPDAGGISISDIDSVEDDSDRPEPAFRREQFSDPPGLADQNEDWWKYHK